MAKWHLEGRLQTWGEHRFTHFLLVGDNDVAVRMYFGRGWFMEYHGPDLDAVFLVYRYPSIEGGDNDRVLGPQCMVMIDSSKLSRPLTPKDYEPIATNLKEVLREHLQFPGAIPPKIERVLFANSQFQPFDD